MGVNGFLDDSKTTAILVQEGIPENPKAWRLKLVECGRSVVSQLIALHFHEKMLPKRNL